MQYIQIDEFGDNLNIVCKEDGNGEPLIFDSLKEAEDTLYENCQYGFIVPLDTNIIKLLRNCKESISSAENKDLINDKLIAELDEVLQLSDKVNIMINNNIQESYCSFEVSKLLKEKGFAIKGNSAYTINKKGEYAGHVSSVSYKYIEANNYIYQPTHSVAIEWIRVNFGIHIYTKTNNSNKWNIYLESPKPFLFKEKLWYNSPKEATEAALLYTLKNLI